MSEPKQVLGVHGASSSHWIGDGFPVRTLFLCYGVQTRGYSFDRTLILNELERTLAAVSDAEIAVAQRMILAANRLFVMGAGRTGLALKMAAMRLMHLGLEVHVAGEVTCPAIGRGDLLLVASGSG